MKWNGYVLEKKDLDAQQDPERMDPKLVSYVIQVKLLQDERIRSDSSQLFFRCYYYFASAVFVVQCISVGYQEQDLVAW